MDFEKEAREIVLQIERQLYFADATQTLTESLRRAFKCKRATHVRRRHLR